MYSQDSLVVVHTAIEGEPACTSLDDGRGIGRFDNSVLGHGSVGTGLFRSQAQGLGAAQFC